MDHFLTDEILNRLIGITGVPIETASSWLQRWNEPHRHYHDQSHLQQLREDLGSNWEDDVFFMVAVFHDIIYNPLSSTNEEDSAKFFMDAMTDDFKRTYPEFVREVHEIILDTKHTDWPRSPKSETFCQADLAVLYSTSMKDLLAYEDKIFKEYQFAPLEQYLQERVKFLKKWSGQNPVLNKLADHISNKRYHIGIYAGSFDPFTIGHLNILQKAERIFDKVIIARGLNPAKSEWTYRLPQCLDFHQKVYIGVASMRKNMQVRPLDEGLYDLDCHPHLANLMMENPDATLIRGLRGATDLDAEKVQQIYVERMMGDVPLNVVYLTCDREYDHISSSAFKQLAKVDMRQAALCCPGGFPI